MFTLLDMLMLLLVTLVPFFITLFEAFMEARRSFRHGLLPPMLINLILYGSSFLWWLFYAGDGHVFTFGAIIIGITFVFSCVIDFIVMFLAQKKVKAK